MTSFDLVVFAAVMLMVGGLVAVIWEILTRDPRALLEMMSDSRRFAEAPLVAEQVTADRRPPAPVEVMAERPRLAA
jgi:hypothetical protein